MIALIVPRSTSSVRNRNGKPDKRCRKANILTLKEQRQEGDNEHQEDTDNASFDPIDNGYQVIATTLSTIARVVGIELANEQRLVQSAQEHD